MDEGAKGGAGGGGFSGKTAPVDYAPPPRTDEEEHAARHANPSTGAAPLSPRAPDVTGASGAPFVARTKPSPYTPPEVGAGSARAQGYLVAGFSRGWHPDHARPRVELAEPPPLGVGDLEGEHKRMRRAARSAWPHVALAFAFEAGLIASAVRAVAWRLFTGADPLFAALASWSVGALVGALVAFAVFHRRWRVIEAFASRYTLPSIVPSLFYVPLVALAYANWRGAKKLVAK